MFLKSITTATLVGLLTLGSASAKSGSDDAKPTIVLVHGAFADSSSWNGVIAKLLKDGYPIIAAANPLRSLKGDAAYVSSILDSVHGPVVLVGHSYAGMVISAAANGHGNVKSLVFVDAYAPDVGETALGLTNLNPGSHIGDALAPPVPTADGNSDLYIAQAKFGKDFATDIAPAQVVLMAAEQRPVTQAALGEPAGQPAWKTIPSWWIYGGADPAIPPKTLAFMAARAGSHHTVVVKGASHLAIVSHPREVAALIEEAAGMR